MSIDAPTDRESWLADLREAASEVLVHTLVRAACLPDAAELDRLLSVPHVAPVAVAAVDKAREPRRRTRTRCWPPTAPARAGRLDGSHARCARGYNAKCHPPAG